MLHLLDRFDRLIAESEARIEEQRRAIAAHEALGMSAREPRRLLSIFEDSLTAYREARASIVETKAVLDGRDPTSGPIRGVGEKRRAGEPD